MLAVEVFTGKVPFSNLKNESVVVQIVGGKRPEKPQAAEQLGLTAEMWKFIEKCWNANPDKRPSINGVVRTWEGFANGYVIISFAWSRKPTFYVQWHRAHFGSNDAGASLQLRRTLCSSQ